MGKDPGILAVNLGRMQAQAVPPGSCQKLNLRALGSESSRNNEGWVWTMYLCVHSVWLGGDDSRQVHRPLRLQFCSFSPSWPSVPQVPSKVRALLVSPQHLAHMAHHCEANLQGIPGCSPLLWLPGATMPLPNEGTNYQAPPKLYFLLVTKSPGF